MRLLAFSDLHRDLDRARSIVERAPQFDAVVGVGDFASQHEGLEEAIEALRPIDVPTILVPGNNETEEALRAACETWSAATVLHAEGTDLDGVPVYGLGAGVPVTPWDWSFDLDEDQARTALGSCPQGAVLAVHSPPYGHVDGHDKSLGSRAVLEAIEACSPRVVLCGHIHECWGEESRAGESPVLNLGPDGRAVDV